MCVAELFLTATVVDAVPALALVPLASSSNCDLVQLPWLASSWMEALTWKRENHIALDGCGPQADAELKF